MDKIAVISDVHGNIPALEAVLTDIRERGIDLIYNLGDLVGKGAHSDFVIDICREVCTGIVRGNWDEGVLRAEDNPIGAWYRVQIGAERLDYLATLPNVIDFWLSGNHVRFFHASPFTTETRIDPWHSRDKLMTMFENTPFTGFDNPPPDIVGYGHIHHPYMRSFPYKTLFNTGCVGNPQDAPPVSYAILNGKYDSKTHAPFSVEFVRLTYDLEAEIENARSVELPDAELYAFELQSILNQLTTER